MASRLLTKAFKKGKNNFENACQLEPPQLPPPPTKKKKSKQTNETQEDISLEFFLFLVLGG